ncbi:MAG: hypothetical protein JNK87_09520 [Bryobacterales bacterium]|nr:hypothetical protein [Bryobacterales bacterium]
MTLAILLAVSVCHTQIVVAEREGTPSKAPQLPAEPRHSLSLDPDQVLPRLLSTDAAIRSAAFRSLGMEYIADWTPTDVRILAVNLDADDELERVVTARSGTNAEAVALDRQEGAWWSVGQWACCGPRATYIEPFLEVRQLVWHGTNDIIVHAGGATGTGVGEQRLSAYRLWNGTLYKVLDILEWAYNWSESEQASVEYPVMEDMDSSKPRIITVRRVKGQGRRSRVVCERYQWDAKGFLFRPLPAGRGGCLVR